MSATFKNSKKKVLQAELRKFMNEHKDKNKSVKKIESPLAKYNESGQLTCILCKSIVRSENVWTVHINSKQHKTNIAEARNLKEKTNNFTTGGKRNAMPPPVEIPVKRIKSILKNSTTPTTEVIVENKTMPDDFFDSDVKKTKAENVVQSGEESEEKMDADKEADVLPEGFFDDPKLDAKARNVEYKDPIEEEWEKFQKEIKDADHESAAIIAEDQEEATNERQIDEIDEQMKNWSRVLSLEKKKVEIVAGVVETESVADEESASSEGEDFDEYLDWRAKKAYK